MNKLLMGITLLTMAGCGQGSSSAGVEDRGDGPSQVATTVAAPKASAPSAVVVSSPYRAMLAKHTPQEGRVVRWGNSVINVNADNSWMREAIFTASNGTGIKFRPGTAGGITYKGYSTARNSVGWSQYRYRNGVIVSCNIWLNPRYLRRYDPAKTMAHELLHCAGMKGHTPTGLMSRYGNGELSATTKGYFRYLYSRRAGERI